jgi:hypothetical protein
VLSLEVSIVFWNGKYRFFRHRAAEISYLSARILPNYAIIFPSFPLQ